MRWRALLLLALLIVAGWWGLNILLRPENLGAWLVSMIEQRSGLQVRVSAPARLDLFGGLRVAMDGLELRLRDSGRAVLRADSLRIALDWSSLWDAPSIRQIELQHPQLDVAALQEWLDSGSGESAEDAAAEPFPKLGAVLLENGIVDFGTQRIESLDATLSARAAGDGSKLDSSKLDADMLIRIEDIEDPLHVSLTAGNVEFDAALRIDGVTLTASLGEVPLVSAEGALELGAAGIGTATFDTSPVRWPDAWLGPAPDWSGPFTDMPMRVAWSNQGNQRRSVVRVTSREAGADDEGAPPRSHSVKLDAKVEPSALIAWWQAGIRWQPPPLRARLDAVRLESEGVVLEGVRLRASPDGRIDSADPASAGVDQDNAPGQPP